MKTKTFNISLPSNLVQKADRVAKKQHQNRSSLIREALSGYIVNLKEWETIFRYGRKRAREAGIKSENDIARVVSQYRCQKGR